MAALRINVLAAKVAGGGVTSCDGANNESATEAAQGVTGAFLIRTTLYAMLSTSAHHLQCYKSTDKGLTWSTVGTAQTPTARGGGMCCFVDGTTIWVSYSAVETYPASELYLIDFDTVGATWGTERSVDVWTLAGHDDDIASQEGPYAAYVRLDGSYVILIGGTVGTPVVWGIVFAAGSFTAALKFSTGGVASQYSSSFMAPDGAVHVFYVSDSHTQGYHQILHADDTVSSKVALPGGLIDWNDTGINWGFIDGATIYLSVGKDTSESGIFGRPAIVWGNDAGWTLSLVLDTSPDIADYSVYSSLLQNFTGHLLWVIRYVSSDGSHYILRVGQATLAGFNDPAQWSWSTIYDLTSPSPLVSGEASPYAPIGTKGLNSSLTFGSDNVFRYLTTMSATDQFVTLLFTAAQSVGNRFTCGPAARMEQGSGNGFVS